MLKYNEEQFNSKLHKAIECTCSYCESIFERDRPSLKRSIKDGASAIYCNTRCMSGGMTNRVNLLCKECGESLSRTNYEIENSKSGNFFCNRSCSSSFNNRSQPKRKRKLLYCNCGSVKNYGRKKCSSCYDLDNRVFLARPISSHFAGEGSLKYTGIRGLARTVYYSLNNKACQMCGYDKHIHVCHIKPISSYSDDTPLGIVNNANNLIGLCPNCHWEFDNGLIDCKNKDP